MTPPGRLYGLRCTVPDAGGDLTKEGYSSGTSPATALATRAAHRIFDALSDPDNGDLLEDVDPVFYGVIVKAMLVHRRPMGQRWRTSRSDVAAARARHPRRAPGWYCPAAGIRAA
jgi:hypothetical protein